MKIMIYASAAVIALAMSVGTVSAEDQFSVVKDVPSVSANEKLSVIKEVPSATTMTDAQLDEVVGGDFHENDNGHFRRRWFHRRHRNGCEFDCIPQ